ncbi:MAG: GDP-mannose 4,6-dehydratase [Acidobacteria bacterium]|jgi:GDP-4-dehydro-6-deoxy-D-mannose reductase|nr:GDP-mannose 4,6-dehydratase [Acidobacteriota bacterium]
MKRILITGCSGFLGTFLSRFLNEKEAHTGNNIEISGITEEKDYQSPHVKVHHADIRDREAIFSLVKTIKPDVTFHLAAIANVGYSWKNQASTYEINFIGSSNLLEAVAEFAPGSRVLLMSTAELYGKSQQDIIDENTPTTARNPYALSKKAMEMLGDLYMDAKKLDIIKLRSFNFTGPGQDRKFVASDFCFQIAEIEKGKQEPIIRVGNLSAVRDISDVRDIARFLKVIAEKGEPGGLYNLCSGKAYSIRELLDILLSLAAVKIEVVVDANKFRPIDIPRLVGDTRRTRETFGLYHEYSIEQTLTDLLNYWRDKVEG